jgi:hypothetical protein
LITKKPPNGGFIFFALMRRTRRIMIVAVTGGEHVMRHAPSRNYGRPLYGLKKTARQAP